MDVDIEEFGTAVQATASSGGNSALPAPYDGEEENSRPLTQWTTCGAKEYTGCQDTFQALTPGMYSHHKDHNDKIIFEHKEVKVDDLIRFPDGVTDAVLNEIENFWQRGDIFKGFGFLHRRGYLFYGPQGSGKTSIVQQIVKDIIDRNGVVFLCGEPDNLNRALRIFRRIEPDRQVVCLFEDIDAIIKDSGEDEVLSLLDGENQIDRVLNIATTNYPERLDRRIISRPRRFDRIMKIDMPNDAVRRVYFERKLPKEEDVALWVAETKGLSLAALAEAVISVKCLGNTFEDTIKALRKMQTQHASSDEFSERVGFGKSS